MEAEAAVTMRTTETAKTVREVAETVANWEVGQIMGMCKGNPNSLSEQLSLKI
jgi:hypothetical protein